MREKGRGWPAKMAAVAAGILTPGTRHLTPALMITPTIETLLRRRDAWLKGDGGCRQMARERAELNRKIAEHYTAFERLRDRVLNASHHDGAAEPEHGLIADLMAHDIVKRAHDRIAPSHVWCRKFLSGGWLEELAYSAAEEAGAEEAIYNQCIGWKVGGFSGENEIDLIVRRGDHLGFLSCKALKSMMGSEDRKHRNRLMDAIHEADNLADHFGRPGERVAVLVTTDLFDEMRGVPRYQALMGKAAVLDVRIIPLEDLSWEKLVKAVRQLMGEQ
jgi:hypothetical protein